MKLLWPFQRSWSMAVSFLEVPKGTDSHENIMNFPLKNTQEFSDV